MATPLPLQCGQDCHLLTHAPTHQLEVERLPSVHSARRLLRRLEVLPQHLNEDILDATFIVSEDEAVVSSAKITNHPSNTGNISIINLLPNSRDGPIDLYGFGCDSPKRSSM